jgi:hypothetical protein
VKTGDDSAYVITIEGDNSSGVTRKIHCRIAPSDAVLRTPILSTAEVFGYAN